MRRLLPSRSPAWWVVVLISLAAVGVFMVFEVLDLDGSDLYKRIFQSPIPSQPTMAEAEGIMRHGAFAVQEALGHLDALVVLQQSSTGFSRCPVAAPAISCERLTRIRARGTYTAPPSPHLHQAMSRLVPLPARSDVPQLAPIVW